MAKYRVKPGYTYGAFGTFREGDIVEIPEVDAGPFLDKLEPVPLEVPAEPDPVPVMTPVLVPVEEAAQEDVAPVHVLEQPAEPKRAASNRKKV